LLLADLVLPGGMSGTQPAVHGKGAHPGIKILLMSRYADEGERTESHAVGNVEFLREPFPGDLLARTVRDALDGAGAEL